jgi:hypothetical protein
MVRDGSDYASSRRRAQCQRFVRREVPALCLRIFRFNGILLGSAGLPAADKGRPLALVGVFQPFQAGLQVGDALAELGVFGFQLGDPLAGISWGTLVRRSRSYGHVVESFARRGIWSYGGGRVLVGRSLIQVTVVIIWGVVVGGERVEVSVVLFARVVLVVIIRAIAPGGGPGVLPGRELVLLSGERVEVSVVLFARVVLFVFGVLVPGGGPDILPGRELVFVGERGSGTGVAMVAIRRCFMSGLVAVSAGVEFRAGFRFGREDVGSASGSGPASVVLVWYGRRVGGLGPGLTSESADAARAVLRDDLPAGPQVYGTRQRCRPDLPGLGRGRGSQLRRPAGACHPFTREKRWH